MGGIISVLYGAVVYLIFLATFLYAIGGVGDLPAPKTIDTGEADGLTAALMINTLLLGLFAVQCSVMARPVFKRGWTRFVPEPIERTTYVLPASLALLLLYWQWRPIPEAAWSATHPAGMVILQAIFWIGWGIVLVSTFLINHFEPFGLRQVYARLRRKQLPPSEFKTPYLYNNARHPLSNGLFGDCVDNWRPSAVRACHHRVYLDRDPARRTRPHPAVR
jgi:methanethiol S-methyltransferase